MSNNQSKLLSVNSADNDGDIVVFKGRKPKASKANIQAFKDLIMRPAVMQMIKEGKGEEIVLFRGRRSGRVFCFMDLPGEIRNMVYRSLSPANHVESLANIREYHKHPLARSCRQLEAEFLPIWHTKCNFMVEIRSMPGWDFNAINDFMYRYNIMTTEHMNSFCIRLDLRLQYSQNYVCPFWSDVVCTLYAKTNKDGVEKDVIEIDFGQNLCIHKTSTFHEQLMTYVNHNLTEQQAFTMDDFVDLAKFLWSWVHRAEDGRPERPIRVCPTCECDEPERARIHEYKFRAVGVPRSA